MTAILVKLLTGYVSGISAGMFGIGGGIVIVTSLIIFTKLNIITAMGTSLTALMLPTGILGVLTFWKQNLINVRTALLVFAGKISTMWIGGWVATHSDLSVLLRLYGLFLLFITWKNIRAGKNTETEESNIDEKLFWLWPYLIGCAAGLLGGLFGIGGGIIIVPLLITIFKYPHKKAIATSLTALMLPGEFSGVVQFYLAGAIKWINWIPVALGLFIGIRSGARITIKLPTYKVKHFYAFYTLIIGMKFLFNL